MPFRNPFRLIRRVSPPERPLRDELLRIERLEERAKSLAASFTVAPSVCRVNRVFPRLGDNARLLRSAYATLTDDVHRGLVVTPAAEWLLDHFHLVTAEFVPFDRIALAPTTASWNDYSVSWRVGATRYEITTLPRRRTGHAGRRAGESGGHPSQQRRPDACG